MRLILWLSICLFALPSFAAISFVQAKANSSGNASSISTGNLTSAVSAGNLLVVFASSTATSATLNSCSDSLGNSFKIDVGPITSGTAVRAYVAHAYRISSGTDSVTCTWSANGNLAISAAEYSGELVLNDPFDVFASGTGTSTSWTCGTTAATTFNSELVVGGGGWAGSGTVTGGNGFDLRAQSATTSIGAWQEDKTITAGGTQSATATLSVSKSYACITATFKDATATPVTRGFVNALTDCGLRGDGVTDDSSALNTCISNNKGKTTWLPKTQGYASNTADYYFASPIQLRGVGTKLIGSAVGGCNTQSCATHLRFVSGIAQGVDVGLGNTCQNCSVEGLEIEGQDPYLSTDSSTGILPAASCNTTSYGTGITGTSTSDGVAVGSTFVTLRNLEIYGWGRFGVLLNGYSPSNADNVDVYNVTSYNNRGSGACSSGSDSNAGSWYQFHAYNNQIGGMEDYSFLGDVCYSCEVHSNHVDTGSTNGPNMTISSAVGVSGTVTVTTADTSSLKVGNAVVVSGTTNYNGTYFVATVSGTQFTFAKPGDIPQETSGTAKRATITQTWNLAGGIAGAGFGYRATGGAVASVWINPYAESDNPPSQFSPTRQLIIGGDMGSGFDVVGNNYPAHITMTTDGLEIHPALTVRNYVDNSTLGNNAIQLGTGFNGKAANNGLIVLTTSPTSIAVSNSVDLENFTDASSLNWWCWMGGTSSPQASGSSFTDCRQNGTIGGQTWFPNGFKLSFNGFANRRVNWNQQQATPSDTQPAGSIYWATDVSAPGYIGWVNTDGGTTWKAFGAVSDDNSGTSWTLPTVKATTSLVIGGGTAITKHLSATASLDYAAWAGGDCQDLTVAVTGAADGDSVEFGVPNALASVGGVQFTAFVSSSSTITVRGCKVTSGASSDPAAATVRVDVWKH